ncbi:MAG: hypothetical protein IJ087_12370, partial [Eggerthellaceae bacterium]|nr:hypothetical protein [Eggerthellaceae bacterium]
MRKAHIVLAVLAALAAAVLFTTYGTVLPGSPFAPVPIDGAGSADSDGDMTVVVDSGSRRALILNADNSLTGVVGCTTADTPIDAITDACAADGLVYLAGVRFAPDSDVIEQERVVAYDKGGNLQGTVLEIPGSGSVSPAIKSLSDIPNGVAVAYEKRDDPDAAEGGGGESADGSSDERDIELGFVLVDSAGIHEFDGIAASREAVHDAAFSIGDESHYATLSFRGVLSTGASDAASQAYAGHVFTAIDVGDDGTLYACDDETGALFVVDTASDTAEALVSGNGFRSVHENNRVISLCGNDGCTVMLCNASGAVMDSFTEANPSAGFSARMTAVWASGLYLAVLAVVLAARKTRRLVAAGETTGIGPMFLAVAVVSAIAIAIGSLSFSAYQSSLDSRAREINAYADYLQDCAPDLGEPMERADDRNALRGDDDRLSAAIDDLVDAAKPALLLVNASNNNGIGMYCTVYGRDSKGIFYLYGSSFEHVMGTSARASSSAGLDAAFELDYPQAGEILQGRTLRDTAQYRLVQIPSVDGKRVAGVIEIGSKMRSFEASVKGDLARRVIVLLVMVLVVYLAYSELRACGRCLLSFRQRRESDPVGSVAELTRPFTLAITMLTSVDSVMTVLIARDLLERAGAGDSSPLLALPAVMLGLGLVAGQGLYGLAGPRVGLRRLVACGAATMLVCACLAGA